MSTLGYAAGIAIEGPAPYHYSFFPMAVYATGCCVDFDGSLDAPEFLASGALGVLSGEGWSADYSVVRCCRRECFL